jgi:zinc/manganese transport system substrate-binding protein
MKRTLLLLLGLAALLEAKVTVVTSYAYIADLVREVGGERVAVSHLAKPTRDPHFIVPSPSYIARVRSADLVVVNGGELEIGWMPPLLAQSGNGRIQPETPGYCDLSRSVAMTGKPRELSRAHGDVHPGGNPHFALDMAQIPAMAALIAEHLCLIDTANCAGYTQNHARFAAAWETKRRGWQQRLKKLSGTAVIQAHALFDYLLEGAGIVTVETLEPIPGVSPTARHTAAVIETIRTRPVAMLVTSVYFPQNVVELVAERTGIRVVTLSHDVGAITGVDSVDAMFEYAVAALTR